MNDQDKELVKMAAKACGITNYTELCEVEWSSGPVRQSWGVYMGPNSYAPWNPLLDDGDALRLAVKLRLHVSVFADAIGVGTPTRGYDELKWSGDPCAATRRAISIAAAAVGRDLS